jgi:hypothetical protein
LVGVGQGCFVDVKKARAGGQRIVKLKIQMSMEQERVGSRTRDSTASRDSDNKGARPEMIIVVYTNASRLMLKSISLHLLVSSASFGAKAIHALAFASWRCLSASLRHSSHTLVQQRLQSHSTRTIWWEDMVTSNDGWPWMQLGLLPPMAVHPIVNSMHGAFVPLLVASRTAKAKTYGGRVSSVP